MSAPIVIALEPVLLTPDQAAAALAMSRDSFDRYAGPEIACVRRGRLRLYAVDALKAWAAKNATSTTDDLRKAA